ncbi:hypothetical protein E2P81_ATG09471 [Venturia nashicola]|uniref:Uncharacterized protein n=1 Tax=Venturia nashicola TaxID=86259 RepID=A0A4Z1NMH9_9PEZI|nr:hypothetical protein E6O75_ATG09679 [Venturia nashicola]TLD25814.1 hypothetical protein E2P81_ATG09471 [Venturia nashicola]
MEHDGPHNDARPARGIAYAADISTYHTSALLDFPETEMQPVELARSHQSMAEWVDSSQTPDYKPSVIPIYRPAGRTRGRIFAFHGIGGSWRKTWTHENVFWLRDLLPKKFPDCEICSIGWQRWPSGTNMIANDISEHMRRTPIDRKAPIVFIVHGISPFHEVCATGAPHHLSRSLEDYIKSISAGDGAKAFDYPRINKKNPVCTEAEVTVGSLDGPPGKPGELETVKCMSVPKTHSEMSKFYVEADSSFADLCKWLEEIFGYLLPRDTSWDLSFVPLSACDPDPHHTEVKRWNYWQNLMSNGSKFRDRWFHLSVNHEEEITNVFRYIEMSHTKLRALDALQIGKVLREKTDFPLGEVLRAKTDFSHGRYVLPNASCYTLASSPHHTGNRPTDMPNPEVHDTIFLRIADLPPRLLKVGGSLIKLVEAKVVEMREKERRRIGNA